MNYAELQGREYTHTLKDDAAEPIDLSEILKRPLPACVARLTDQQVRKRILVAQNEVLVGQIRMVNRPGFPFRMSAAAASEPVQREFNSRPGRVLDNLDPFYRNAKETRKRKWWRRLWRR